MLYNSIKLGEFKSHILCIVLVGTDIQANLFNFEQTSSAILSSPISCVRASINV